jgi:SAM-dependent methyltransferase
MPLVSYYLCHEQKLPIPAEWCIILIYQSYSSQSVPHMSKTPHQFCPLCQSNDFEDYCTDKQRDYLLCPVCHLVFVPHQQFLSRDEEKARYDEHQNSPTDTAYRNFLGRLFIPLSRHLKPGSEGLDFGSGPGPTLSIMFEEAGYKMSIYDYFFAHNPAVFNKHYDFITATEVVEHLHQPAEELNKLWNCLKPGGWLGIMTKQLVSRQAFNNWHYKRDLTHVCFFSRKTFHWLSHEWHAPVEFIGKDVVLFYKQDVLNSYS